jgi:hypothetical protein
VVAGFLSQVYRDQALRGGWQRLYRGKRPGQRDFAAS